MRTGAAFRTIDVELVPWKLVMKRRILIASRVAIVAALLSGPARAADLASTKPSPAAPAPASFSWKGAYIGGYAGALLGDGTFDYFEPAPVRGAALIGGGTLGYNWEWSPTVIVGLEADFGYRGPVQSQRQNRLYPGPTDGGVLGTARARLGYAFAPQWLAYATGGFAFGTDLAPRGFTSTWPLTVGRQETGTTVRAGWTVGGGVEHAWTDRISVKAEYLYVRLADSGVAYATNLGSIPLGVTSAGHIVRGGLNYHFVTGSSAIVPPSAN
jgi:outer membrane immunogenic protein